MTDTSEYFIEICAYDELPIDVPFYVIEETDEALVKSRFYTIWKRYPSITYRLRNKYFVQLTMEEAQGE